MNIIIERLGEDITPHVQGLLPLLPRIWQEAHDQSLLRIQVRHAHDMCLLFDSTGQSWVCKPLHTTAYSWRLAVLHAVCCA